MRDPDQRFWEKVNRDGPLILDTPCWVWTARVGTHGYGEFRIPGYALAHRYSWARENGPIPRGFEIDHICRNRLCVNPSHLRCGTRKENSENLSAAAHSTNVTSQYRGVSYMASRNLWRAQVTHNQKQYFGGWHKTEQAAAQAARQLRNRLFTHNDADRV